MCYDNKSFASSLFGLLLCMPPSPNKLASNQQFKAKPQSCWIPMYPKNWSCHSFIFTPTFPLGRAEGSAAPGGLDIPHGFQQFLIVLTAPHQDETMSGRICNNATSPLVDLLAAFSCVQSTGLASQLLPGAFWSRTRTIVVEISLFAGG